MDNHAARVFLIGNPNSGKTTLFNQLTGLQQKTGNFPGVTIERKSGILSLPNQSKVELIDLPGTYSIYPKSQDEQVAVSALLESPMPEAVVVVADASNLQRNLLLFTQVYDLGFPTVLCLNMIDIAEKNQILIHIDKLTEALQCKVVAVNAYKNQGIQLLKYAIADTLNLQSKKLPPQTFAPIEPEHAETYASVSETFGILNPNTARLLSHIYPQMPNIDVQKQSKIKEILQSCGFDSVKLQAKETILRYQKIQQLCQSVISYQSEKNARSFTQKLDRVVTHRVVGYAILLALFYTIFQSIFLWAQWPMDAIDGMITFFSNTLKASLPAHWVSDLLTDGILAGIGGIVVFIPQIALLFVFITLLEESGYMARVMYLMDRLMKPFGLNGKSIVPLFSGAACAIPAILATRNISHARERLITIFVTPLISCSARIPVYTIIIALIIPPTTVFGVFNSQGLALLAMYMLGFVMALISALLLKVLIPKNNNSFFVLEMPDYKWPSYKTVFFIVWEKVKSFVTSAGKIILGISIILWGLSSFGPGDNMQVAEQNVIDKYEKGDFTQVDELDTQVAAARLEASYIGILGKFIEPVFAPLGFDWKTDIAILSSFAAREVFVGTLSTLHSVGSSNNEASLKQKLANYNHPSTGKPYFNLALGASLLVFYAFALQCMSTIAVVKQETGKWKIALLQFTYMGFLAYIAGFLAHHIFGNGN